MWVLCDLGVVQYPPESYCPVQWWTAVPAHSHLPLLPMRPLGIFWTVAFRLCSLRLVRDYAD